MSAKSMGQVFDHEMSASEYLVLLALADHADHNGENAWPAVELIAWKVGLSERGVRYILRRFERRDPPVLIEQRPPGPGRPRTYRIVFSSLPKKEPLVRDMGARRAPLVGARVAPVKGARRDARGANRDDMGARIGAPEPSSEPSSEPANAKHAHSWQRHGRYPDMETCTAGCSVMRRRGKAS